MIVLTIFHYDVISFIHFLGIRQNLKVVDSLKPDIPASNQYTPELANRQVWASSPSFTMGSKPHKEFWKKACK